MMGPRVVAATVFRTMFGIACLVCVGTADAQAPTVETTMQFQPKQRDVDYEIPKAAEYPKCKVDGERKGKSFTWVVTGAQGQVLRRFVDSDGDNKFDQWRYYQHGIEVYRDLDTNKNGKPDQARWLNLGGSRWGIDVNEDQVIDRWQALSAAEASRVAIQAMTGGDLNLLQTVLVTAEDLKSLGIGGTLATKILEQVAAAPAEVRAVIQKSKVLTAQSKWVRFDAQMPGVIPADDGKARDDLYVYENAMVVIENGPPPAQPALVQIGEMIRVGEVWKLTKAPVPIEGDTTSIIAGGLLMQPGLGDEAGNLALAAPSPEMQKLIEELQKLDQQQPQLGTAKPAELSAYNSRRADMLLKLMSLAATEDEKVAFLKQCVDGIATAVQVGAYPEGMARLKQMEAEYGRGGKSSVIVPYVTYRRIMAQNAVELLAVEPDKRETVQAEWLKSLTSFVEAYPQSDDAADAMWNLATAAEFASKPKDASEWYLRLVKEKGTSPLAQKAQGAMRRLDMKGKPFALQGRTLNDQVFNSAAYRGKTLLITYWASWSPECKEQLPALKALHQQYQPRGFEIVGVSLDTIAVGTREQQVAQLQQYVTANKLPWPQVYEEGGFDSPPAVQYGVFSVPTMFLIDEKGTVISRGSSVEELKTVLPQLFPSKQANKAN